MEDKKNFNSKKLGKEGEDFVEKYLSKLNYKIIKKNFRFGKGEIDIIAKDNGILVFVEVKYRSSKYYGDPEYSITQSKIRQLKKIAEAYYYINKIESQECRFDVITLTGEFNNLKINHLKEAFY